MSTKESLVLGAAERPETLTYVVLAAIRNAIVNQELPAGARVTEADLARQLNVSKTPVREALLRLREIGLIEPDGRRGGRIISPSRRTISEAYEVREALESYAARAAAERGGRAELAAIEQIARRSLAAAKAGRLDEFRTADDDLHRAISDAAGNERLALTIDQSLSLVSALRRRDVPGATGAVECARDHVLVAKAMRARDPEAAAENMTKHIQRVAAMVLAAFDESGDGETSGADVFTLSAHL